MKPPPTKFDPSQHIQSKAANLAGKPAGQMPPPTQFGPSGPAQAKAAGPAGRIGHAPPPTQFSALRSTFGTAVLDRHQPVIQRAAEKVPEKVPEKALGKEAEEAMVEDPTIKVGWRIYDNKVVNFGNGGFSFLCQLLISKVMDGYVIQKTVVKNNGVRIYEFWEAFKFSSVVNKIVIDYFNNPPVDSLSVGESVIVFGEYGFFTGPLPKDFQVSADIPSGHAPATKKQPSFWPPKSLGQRAIRSKKTAEDGTCEITVFDGKNPLQGYQVDKQKFTK